MRPYANMFLIFIAKNVHDAELQTKVLNLIEIKE